MSRASRRLMASPSPEPSRVRVCPRSTCTNGSKMAARCSSSMPIPVSSTCTAHRQSMPTGICAGSAASSVSSHVTVTRPPGCVKRTAFESRLTRICSTRCGSPM